MDVPGLLQAVTFHLGDSIPRDALTRIYAETGPNDPVRLHRIERLLDAGHGVCWLQRPDIATPVEGSLAPLRWGTLPAPGLGGDAPVHTLIDTLEGYRLPGLVQSWKSFTAKAANALLGRTGTFWERDYFDRYIRDDHHLAAVLNCIEENPVKAGLVARAEDWLWSSAARRRRR